MPPSQVSTKAPLAKAAVLIGGVVLVVLGVLKLPTVYLYLLLFAAGVGAFCMIAYQLIGIMREGQTEVVPAAGVMESHRPGGLAAVLPSDDRIILDWATECLEAGNSLDAGSKLERIAAAYRNHPEVLKLRHRVYFTERRWHAALDVGKSWAEADPGDPLAWEAQACCLAELRQFQQAVNLLEPVAARFPRRTELTYRLARLNAEMGRLEDSQKWLFKALDAGEKPPLIRRALADPALHPLFYFLGRRVLVQKITAGGVHGAERAALEFAERHGIDHAGWCAPMETEEDLRVLNHFSLQIVPRTDGATVRHNMNVQQSEATVIFAMVGDLSSQANQVLENVHLMHKPCLILRKKGGEGDPVAELLTFLEKYRVGVLHITGSEAGAGEACRDFADEVLEAAFEYQLRSFLHGTLAPHSLNS